MYIERMQLEKEGIKLEEDEPVDLVKLVFDKGKKNWIKEEQSRRQLIKKLNTQHVSRYVGKPCGYCGSVDTFPVKAQFSRADEETNVYIECRTCKRRQRQ